MPTSLPKPSLASFAPPEDGTLDSTHAGPRRLLAAWNLWLEQLIDRKANGLAFFIVGAFFVYHAWLLDYRHIWSDELASFYIARTFSWASICEALRLTADGQPPTYHYFQIPMLSLLGDHPGSLRWLSLASTIVTLGAAFVWLRRTTGNVAALAALIMLGSSELSFYAVEARPYAMLTACVMLALVSRRLTWRILWLMLAVSLHYYAAFIPLVLACTEHGWRRRAWYVFAWAPLLITVPAMPPPRLMNLGGPFSPTSFSLVFALPALAGGARYAVLLLLVVGAFAGQFTPSRFWRECFGRPRHTAWALMAMVPICWLLGEYFTGIFFRRYAIVSLLGLAGLVAWFLHRMPRRAILAVGFALFSFGCTLTVQPTARWDARETARVVDRELAGSTRAVVMGQPSYLELRYYLSPAARARFHRLTTDRPSFTTYYAQRPHNYHAYSEMIGKYAGFTPMGLEDWLRGHSSFVLVVDSDEDWVLAACRRRGAALVPIAHSSTHQLYRVTLPHSRSVGQVSRLTR